MLTFHRMRMMIRRMRTPAIVARTMTHQGMGGASSRDFAGDTCVVTSRSRIWGEVVSDGEDES